MDLLTKAVTSAELSEEGEVVAVIARIGELDHDDDYLEKGAFGEQEVAISAWGHDWSKEPRGRGILFEEGSNVLFKGKFFDTPEGKNAYNVVKEMSTAQGKRRPNGILEWSYGFHLTDGGYEDKDVDGVTKNVFVLREIDAFEVSPVYRGAGINTHTLDIKRKKSLEYKEESEKLNHARKARKHKANMARFLLEESQRKWGYNG